MSLARYRSKRDFSKTSEPPAAKPARQTGGRLAPAKLLFVVQKHAAKRLHYDFRIELDGVLKSWAVPKGFPLLHGEKRLAMQVEDHPVQYGGFEGTIPPGNYGAGTVMVWDAGVCQMIETEPRAALRQGKMEFQLEGQKLKGRWTLVRMRAREGRDENAWLLIKTEDDARPISARSDDRSILSQRTMKQITARAERTWSSPRKQSRKSERHVASPSRKAATATDRARGTPVRRRAR
jgi:bifunctional non-homologous end joining protein LigD